MFAVDTSRSDIKDAEVRKNYSREEILEQNLFFRDRTEKKVKLPQKLLSKPAWVDSDDENAVVIDASNKKFNGIFLSDSPDIPALKYNAQIQKKHHKLTKGNTDWSNKRISGQNDNYFGNHVLKHRITKQNKHNLNFKWIMDIRLILNSTNNFDIHEEKSPVLAKNYISTAKFHPSYKVMFSTQKNGCLNLYKIESENIIAKLQKIILENYIISDCSFLTYNYDQILFVGSNVRYLYNFDVISGKFSKIFLKTKYTSINPKFCDVSCDGKYLALYSNKSGRITLMSQKSKEVICILHTTGSCVVSVKFSPESRLLTALSDNGQIFVWDINCLKESLNSIPPLHQFTDTGNNQPTSLNLTKDGRYLLTGSHSGIVNLYDINESINGLNNLELNYVKCWKNISLPCTTLISNPDSDLLLFGSRYKKDCVKMVNLKDLQLFKNFPGNQRVDPKNINLDHNPLGLTYLNSITCGDFSPNSGYMILGSNMGNLNLYRLNSYPQY